MFATMTLALIAHDRRKDLLADFALDRRTDLRHFRLLATRGTGTAIQNRTHLPLHLLDPGLAGGDQQVRRLAEAHEIAAVIFFRDPDGPAPYEPTFAGLQQVCDSLEIPLATNAATAAALLFFLRTSPERAIVAARPWGQVAPGDPAPGRGAFITTDLQSL